MAPDFSLEQAVLDTARGPVAGVDEAGRGPWAGPVVAAAVMLDPASIPDGLNDSKKLAPEARDSLFASLHDCAGIGIGIVDVEVIDRDNILAATMRAMADAVEALAARPGFVLVDGNRMPDLAIPAQTVVKGDQKSLSIAAASIVAKVTRDRIMVDLDTCYPGYGFARHKGYGTRQHAAALEQLGVCAAHRKSFTPIRQRLVR